MASGVADASTAPERADGETVMDVPASPAAGRLDVRAGRLTIPARQPASAARTARPAFRDVGDEPDEVFG